MTQQQKPVRGNLRNAPIERALSDPNKDLVRVRISLPVAGNCTRPAHVSTSGGKENEYIVRCRNCPSCLRARQHLWRLRGEWEVLVARRSWLFTGTFRAQSHDRTVAAAEVTRWLKRLRINMTRKYGHADIRYLVMYERHKSGAWHIHALLHTVSHMIPTVFPRKFWTAGFSDCKVVDVQGASYVVKYSTKSLLDNSSERRPRIRASRRYGAAVMLSDKEEVQAAMARKKPQPLHETWTQNLIEALRIPKTRKRELWQFMMEVQAAHGQITTLDQDQGANLAYPGTIERLPVDPATGEIIRP